MQIIVQLHTRYEFGTANCECGAAFVLVFEIWVQDSIDEHNNRYFMYYECVTGKREMDVTLNIEHEYIEIQCLAFNAHSFAVKTFDLFARVKQAKFEHFRRLWYMNKY